MVHRIFPVVLFVVAILSATEIFAQSAPPDAADVSAWQPSGPIPVDQAGAGRRGYVLPGEGAGVLEPGASEVSLHFVAANTFYREQTDNALISERYEAHTAALEFRHGVRVGALPPLELGAQVQFTESDSGMLNGFISGFEDWWAGLTGRESAKNQLRSSAAVAPPLGTVVIHGQSFYAERGDRSGFGDVLVTAKMRLHDAPPQSSGVRVAARAALNLSGATAFTQGNFAGFGISLDKKVLSWAAVHADVRGNLIFDSESAFGLPLSRSALAFSFGPELKLTRNGGLHLQIDGSTTPYQPTGITAFDSDYGAITVGASHRFSAGQRHVLAHLYARENMNLPFRVRWNADPDLAIGMKLTIY